MRRTILLALVATCLALPAAAQEPDGLAPGSYQLRLPGAGSVVAEVADDGGLAVLVVPAAVEMTLTAAGDLVVDDLLESLPVDPPPDPPVPAGEGDVSAEPTASSSERGDDEGDDRDRERDEDDDR